MPKYYLVVALMLLWSSCDFFSKTAVKKKSGPGAFQETAELTEQIEGKPNDAKLYFKRGTILRTLKQDSLAIVDYQKAISLDSTNAVYYSAMGDLLFDHKDVSGSLGWIQKAIQLDPNDQTAHLKLARMFLFTSEYNKAFIEINTVLRADVYNTEAYFLKGMCYKSMKDTNLAISSFQTAVQSDPKNSEAYLQLAILHEARKNALALDYFENAYKADSSNLEPLYGKAMYWQNQQNFSEAKKVFNRMIGIDRNYPKSFYNMGWMLLQEDSTEKAIRNFSIAIEVKPDYAEAYFNRGLCYEIQGNFKAAAADYNQSLNFNAQMKAAQEALARIQPKIK